MIKKIILFFFFINLFNSSVASVKSKIIENFNDIDNISFHFIQNIDDLQEKGKCVIQYPKKIHCTYDNKKKKLIVSNGSSLVIKNQNGKAYFRYLLKQTSLMLILDKDLLIKKIEKLEENLINDQYYIFYLENGGYQINIFFDKNSYDLIGWQTEDIYQKLVITYIYKIKKNIDIDQKLFILPKPN
jgi:outer membrane lipoprotein-sorting protein